MPSEAFRRMRLYGPRTYVHSEKAKFSHIQFYPQEEEGISGRTSASIPR